MTIKLKPCPFCGSLDIELYETRVKWFRCMDCGAECGIKTVGGGAETFTKASARRTWNRRTP